MAGLLKPLDLSSLLSLYQLIRGNAMVKMAKTLKEYLDEHSETIGSFAQKTGYSNTMVSYWLSGRFTPRLRARHAIAKATNNEVPIEVWE